MFRVIIENIHITYIIHERNVFHTGTYSTTEPIHLHREVSIFDLAILFSLCMVISKIIVHLGAAPGRRQISSKPPSKLKHLNQLYAIVKLSRTSSLRASLSMCHSKQKPKLKTRLSTLLT
jgi:hypothetical protein